MYGPVVICSGYARNGDYSQLLRAVAIYTNNGAIPFVVLADFNADADKLRASTEVDALKAVVFSPQDGEKTCFSGINGTAIDYLVCSESISPHLKTFTRVLEVPWAPGSTST